MNSILVGRLTDAMLLSEQLLVSIGESSLTLRNGTSPSNSIGGQFWCLIGGRESYARAIAMGKWSGFACSICSDDTKQREKVRVALSRSRQEVLDAIARNQANDQRTGIALEVLEHETLHHGQLVRYFYANALQFPDAFARRYALTQPNALRAKRLS